MAAGDRLGGQVGTVPMLGGAERAPLRTHLFS